MKSGVYCTVTNAELHRVVYSAVLRWRLAQKAICVCARHACVHEATLRVGRPASCRIAIGGQSSMIGLLQAVRAETRPRCTAPAEGKRWRWRRNWRWWRNWGRSRRRKGRVWLPRPPESTICYRLLLGRWVGLSIAALRLKIAGIERRCARHEPRA